jgi:hypothetical protein
MAAVCADCNQPTDGRRRCYSCASRLQWRTRMPKRPFVVFDGVRYFRQADGYWKSGDMVSLHRVVWESAHGPLADGLVVHHIDENPSNNDLSNLQAMTIGEHRVLHQTGRAWSPEVKAKLAESGRASWVGAPSREWPCEVCGETFSSRSRYQPRFCGNRCQQTAKRREKRALLEKATA